MKDTVPGSCTPKPTGLPAIPRLTLPRTATALRLSGNGKSIHCLVCGYRSGAGATQAEIENLNLMLQEMTEALEYAKAAAFRIRRWRLPTSKISALTFLKWELNNGDAHLRAGRQTGTGRCNERTPAFGH